MKYQIEIEQAHLQRLLVLLETTPLPLRESWPIYESLRRQRDAQDVKQAVPIGAIEDKL